MPSSQSSFVQARRAPGRAVVGLAVAAALALASGPALAQTKAPAKPAQAPAPAQPAPAPAQEGPIVVPVKADPGQSGWLKVCGKDQAQNKEVCYTTRDFVADNGEFVLATAIYNVQGDQEKIVRFLLPLGFLVQPGIRFGVDNGQQSAGRFAICFPNGCFVEARVKEDFIKQMKSGTNLNISIQNQFAREVTFQVPAAGFAKGFDGPPIDPKELEDQQKKLQEELQKRGEALRQQQQQQQSQQRPAGAPPALPGAPAPKP